MKNAALLTELALQLTLQAAEYMRVTSQAVAENRDVSDDEVAAARVRAQASIDALKAAAAD